MTMSHRFPSEPITQHRSARVVARVGVTDDVGVAVRGREHRGRRPVQGGVEPDPAVWHVGGGQSQPALRAMRMASMRLRAPTLLIAFDR
jgi:hypothetical protein